MKDRIRLAEAIGWTPQPNEPNGEPVWLSPDGEDPCYLFELPDPFTDANDTDALIAWLNEQGLELVIVHGIGYARILLMGGKLREKTFKPISVGEQGDECSNWKAGICELALKVLP